MRSKSLEIKVQGRSFFTQLSSVGLGTSVGSIHATNSAKDLLTLTFTIPNPDTWDGFNQGTITGGQLVFGALDGFFLGANGVISRDPTDAAIVTADPPPVIDPPPHVPDPPPTVAVPELSTWAMMLLGLAGLGLAAKRRRAIGFLGGKA